MYNDKTEMLFSMLLSGMVDHLVKINVYSFWLRKHES